MQIRQFIVATCLGAITVMVTGYLLFAVIFADFYARAMSSGLAVGVQRDAPVLWAAAAGAVSYSTLITLAIRTRKAPVRVADGIRIGSVVGLLVWLTADLMLYAIADVASLATTLLEPVLELIPGAAAGAVIAWALTAVEGADAAQLNGRWHVPSAGR